MVNSSDALSALTRLGFTEYEAKVFIALQRLGKGTARDVHRITDVPRSQVYSVAEQLEAAGFLSIQQSTPREYRPITPNEARNLMSSQFERDLDLVIEYITDIQGDYLHERREDLWTVRGTDAINSRILQLLDEAKTRIIMGIHDPSLLTPTIEKLVRDQAANDIHVIIISSLVTVMDRFRDETNIRLLEPPDEIQTDDHMGLILVIDDDTVLNSVRGARDDASVPSATAYWSTGSAFASMFISFVERTFDEVLPSE